MASLRFRPQACFPLPRLQSACVLLSTDFCSGYESSRGMAKKIPTRTPKQARKLRNLVYEVDMKLLKDDELKELYKGEKPVIAGVPAPSNWTEANSPVQPSSIDLHIGKISVPAEHTAQEPTKMSHGRHPLPPGQTAVVTTLEHLHMTRNLAAVGFPPSHVSVQGILMTNPGHVDPGYA